MKHNFVAVHVSSRSQIAPGDAPLTQRLRLGLVYAFTVLIVLPLGTLSFAQQSGGAAVGTELSNLHASIATGLSSGDAAQLEQAWHIQTPEPVSHTPLLDNGRIYFADWGGTVYAADATSGKVAWQQQVETPKTQWPWYGFAGTGALGDGMLFEASAEGNAFGIDAATGAVKWQTQIGNNKYAGSISHLLYHDGLVYVGLSSVEEPISKQMQKQGKTFFPSFQGKVLALDAQTGKVAWEHPLVQGQENGVAMWSSFALDPKMNALFFATGNNYTGAASELSDALVAVNAKTGEVLWKQQVTDEDVWTPATPKGPDYDFGAGPQLFEATINGQTRQLIGAGQKSGIYWVFDRSNGTPVWHTTVGYGSVAGGIRGEASVGNGQVFVWSNNNYKDSEPTKHPISVKALNAADGRVLWFVDKAQPAIGTAAGVLTNDVYLVGSLDGTLSAYATTGGKQVWSTKAPGSVASSLAVGGNTLFVGTGIPKMFGGLASGNGVSAYSVGGQPNLSAGGN